MAVVVLHESAPFPAETRLKTLVFFRSCRLAGAYSVNALFAFGYSAQHLWVTQKKASDPDQCLENRLLIVEF